MRINCLIIMVGYIPAVIIPISKDQASMHNMTNPKVAKRQNSPHSRRLSHLQPVRRQTGVYYQSGEGCKLR